MKKINLKDAKCTELSLCAAVELKKSDDDITGFELIGYTGAAVDRWWGKLVIDLSGMSSKQKMPIFRGHNHSDIVGFSTDVTISDAFTVRGSFSDSTESAKEVKALAKEGFPWQASIGVDPKVIMELKEGTSLEVNGITLSGPAEVWTQSEVYETSFVPLGADGNTSATVFSIKEAEQPAKQPERVSMDFANISIADLKKNRPDLMEEILEGAKPSEEALANARKEGGEKEMLRIKAVHEQSYPGHEDLVSAAMFDGKSQPGDVAMQINAANLKAQKDAGEDMSSDAPPPVTEPAVSTGESHKKGKMTEEKLKAKWNKDSGLRDEFMGDFDLCKASLLSAEGLAFKSLRNRGE